MIRIFLTVMDYFDFDFISSYLRSGESVLWQGKPQKNITFTPNDIFLIPFSLVWCGFALFWEYSVLQTGNAIMILFGLPFVLVGLFLVFGRFVLSAYKNKHTAYVITDERIFRKTLNRIDTLQFDDLPPVSLTLNKDGTGTILIGNEYVYSSHRGGRMAYNTNAFKLESIQEPQNVHQLILDQSKKYER